MWILQGHLYGRTRTVQVKSGMSIDSHPESYVLVQTASRYSPGKYVNCNLCFFQWRSCILAMWNSSRSPVRPYKNCTGQVWYVPLILIRRATFWSERLVRTVLGSMLTGIWVFSMEILYISYGEFFKVTCTAVQELYRSSLVCPLILIRRATFCVQTARSVQSWEVC